MTSEDVMETPDLVARDLAELRRLLDAATPGPWTLCPDLRGCGCGHGTQSIDARDGNVVIAEFRDLTDPPNESESNNTEPVEIRRANAALIVAAVNALPHLLALLDHPERLTPTAEPEPHNRYCRCGRHGPGRFVSDKPVAALREQPEKEQAGGE